MRADVLDDCGAVQALASEWASLWRACPAATPFQHPAWLLPWWSAFGTGQPRVATWRADGRLAGLLPAYILDQGATRKALPFGAGTTDYLDALGTGIPEMLAALRARLVADAVPTLDWFDAPPDAVIIHGCPEDWLPATPCPVANLADIPAGMRRKQRMSQNRAERAGGWAVETVGCAGLGTLIALHQTRWTAAAQPGVLADPAVLRCLREALPQLEAAGLLRLQVLLVRGAPAAAILALLAPGRIFFYLSGYDAAHAFVSPGTILLGAMLDQAAAEGRTEAHFLRGQEPYKYAWGAADRLNRARVIATGTAPGAASITKAALL